MRIEHPSDLEPDEEPLLELEVLLPPPDARFTDEVTARLNQRAMATSFADAFLWLVSATVHQIFAAVFTLLGGQPAELEVEGEE